MSQIRGRECLSRIEDYVVETVPDADIIVNANETNEPMGKKMEKKLVNAVLKEALNRYPSMHGEDLCAFLGKKYSLDPYLFCLGNGSSELLEKVCFAFGGKGRKIAYPAPSFSMYETYITLSDSTPVPYRLDEEFKVDADAVIKFCKKEKPDVLIVNNPNNPTGTYNARQMMEKIIRSVDALVVMDEAYIEFSNGGADAEENSTLPLVADTDHLLVLRTLSKAYGLAGLRIGFGAGSRAVMKILHKVLLPYHVNRLTLAIALAFLKSKNYLKKRVAAVVKAREALASDLGTLGFTVLPSGTNFLLVMPKEETLTVLFAKSKSRAKGRENMAKAAGKTLFEGLLARKILVRNYSQHPLLPGALRISTGTLEENARIIEAVKEILEG